MSAACIKCGFSNGERVTMRSSVARRDTGESFGMVHGTVHDWPEGQCHIVLWKETGLVTGLPNPNVRLDATGAQ